VDYTGFSRYTSLTYVFSLDSLIRIVRKLIYIFSIHWFGWPKAERSNNYASYCLITGERDLNSLTPEEVLSFLTDFNQGTNQLTKRTRYSQLTSFFNFPTQNRDSEFRSPCDTPMLKKLYRPSGPIRWTILEKEVVDEIIFRTVGVG
jgi:hypothetical protein